MQTKRILIIEDELSIADLLAYSLTKEGYVSDIASSGEEGLSRIACDLPDLVLLDLMLPDMSGFDVCKKVAGDYAIPVVMLTAKSDIVDKVLGMELGAHDYITKPFDLREVTARIRAIFRRAMLSSEQANVQDDELILPTQDVVINMDKRVVTKHGTEVSLTNKEYDLLTFLVQNRGKVYNRADLLDKVWAFEYVGDTRTVDIHVQRLRRKLDDGEGKSIITTVFGVGYKVE